MPERNILLVEDDVINALLFKKVLSGKYSVTHASDGLEAIDIAQKNSFDLVLMDINLGRNSPTGVEVLATLRQTPNYINVPMIAITAYALDSDRERFYALGFDEYLAKPVSKAELEHMVVSHLPV